MSQISPPLRILLVAVLGLLVVFMLFLRPKPQDTVAPAAKPVAATPAPTNAPNAQTPSKVGAIVQKAVRAAQGASGSRAPGTAKLTGEQLAALPRDVRSALVERKVLVLLFYNGRSSDDKAVRRALSHVHRHGGKVFVDAHWIKNVGRYQAITRGADLEQSPTTIVVDRDLKAESLVGYVDTQTIDQAVADALRAGR